MSPLSTFPPLSVLLISPRKEKALWISPTAVLVVTQGLETGWESVLKFRRSNSYGNASVMKHPVGQLLGQGKVDKRYRKEAHGGKREMLAFTARERKGKKGGGEKEMGGKLLFSGWQMKS